MISLKGFSFLAFRRQYSKRVNLKTGVTRKGSTPKFPKNEHFLPPDTYTDDLRFALLPYHRQFSLCVKDVIFLHYNISTVPLKMGPRYHWN